SFLFELIEDEQQRHSVCTRIYELVKQANGDLPFGFFSSWGKFLTEVFTINMESMVSILEPLIENRNEQAIKWLARLVSEKPALIQGHSHSIHEFKRTVLVALSQPEDSSTPFISELARTIGFVGSLPPPPWTVETLGEPTYKFIAKEGGYFDPDEEPSL